MAQAFTMDTTPRRHRHVTRLGHPVSTLQAPPAAAHSTFPWGRSEGWPQMVPKKGTGKPRLAIVSTEGTAVLVVDIASIFIFFGSNS